VFSFNIATGAVTDYTWDARNRLVGVTDETSAYQITQTVTYVYDVENRCVSETVTAYSGGSPTSVHTTDYAYDGNQIVLQFDATSTPGTPVTLTAADLSHRYLNGPAVDQVLADERVTLQNGALATDEVLWPLADAQGTVRDVAKLNGTTAAVVDHIMYNSFGGVVSESDPSQGVLFRSTGCFTDPATDIEFHEERDKIAGSIDWLKIDQSGYTSGTTNLYGYCGESPTNATDPTGLGAVKFGALTVILSPSRQEIYDDAQSQLVSMGYVKTSVEYQLRKNIVLAALTTSLDFGGGGGWRSPSYWTVAPDGYYHVRPGTSPAAAVLDAWVRGNKHLWAQQHRYIPFPQGETYTTGCKKCCELIYLMGLELTCYRLDHGAHRRHGSTYLSRFDALIGSNLPSDLFNEPSVLQTASTSATGFTLADLTPGDRVWVQNPTPTGSVGDEGTNLIYAGDGVFVSYNGTIVRGGLPGLFHYVQVNHALTTTAGLKIAEIFKPKFPF
jgi:YD repeat-containing protein